MHASTRCDLRSKSVGIFGCGPIGLFTILTARALGASRIIGIEPNEENASLAEALGADEVVRFTPKNDWRSDDDVVRQVREFGAEGVSVSFEMAGFNSSLNNAIRATRKGGDVILFGIKGGDFTIEDFQSLIVRGISMHSVIGRRIFSTWETTTSLLETKVNQIHDKIRDIILRKGEDTVVHIDDYDIEDFEKRIMTHPKVLIQWNHSR